MTIISPINDICAIIAAYANRNIKNYGECVESLVPDEAANYVTIDGKALASVNDNFEGVFFYTKLSASPNTQSAGGRSKLLTRDVVYRIAVNTRIHGFEQIIAFAINKATNATYISSSFDSKNIARNFFGIKERATNTEFFTIDFSAIERIDCPNCP